MPKNQPIELTIDHCMDVLDTEIIIGSVMKTKQLTYNAWTNEYTIWFRGDVMERANYAHKLLEKYNEL